MAAVYYDATAMLSLAIEKIQPVVGDVLLNDQKLLKYFDKVTPSKLKKRLRFADNKYIIPTTIGYPGSFRGIDKQSPVPLGGAATRIRMTASHKKLVGIVNVDYETTIEGENQGDAYVLSAVDTAQDDILRMGKHMLNTQLHGNAVSVNGTLYGGKLAKVYSQSGTGVTLYLQGGTHDASGEMGAKWLSRGLPVVIDTAANLAAGTENTSCYTKIASVTDGETIVLEDDLDGNGVAQGDIIVLGELNSYTGSSVGYNEFGKTLTGLDQHLGNSGTYQGQSRTTYPEICGNYYGNGGTLQDLTEGLLQQAVDGPLEYTGGDDDIDLIITTPAMRRQVYDILEGYRRFNGTVSVGDHRDIKQILKTQFEVDPYARPGRILGLNKDSFTFGHADSPFRFEKGGVGGGVLRMVGTSASIDVYELRCRVFAQLMCSNPRKSFCIADLTQ